ncbi:hypothetical protein [Candidatus Palauibacter sp.]|uniref:hypothetical protein n=1 Tax=Candidatus Palauibacter sp. TaxID=3101350 RepID=UPI003D0B2D0D
MKALRALALPSTFLLAFAACGGTTGPSIPEVAGTYTGSLTVEATAVFGGMPETISATGSMRVLVQQDADRVTLSGSITTAGDTESIEAISGTIDGAGVWTETGSGAGSFLFEDDECGYVASSEVRFSDGSLEIEAAATRSEPTVDCPNVAMSAELTRS